VVAMIARFALTSAHVSENSMTKLSRRALVSGLADLSLTINIHVERRNHDH